MMRRRLLAVAALVLAPLAVVSAVGFAASDPQEAFGVLLTLSLAVVAAAYGLVRRGAARAIALVLAGLRRLVPRRPWREWSAPGFEVRSAAQVPVGIDGEATILTPPLRFRTLACALRVRIAPGHPGASPSATRPDGVWCGFRALVSIAAGRTAAPRRRR